RPGSFSAWRTRYTVVEPGTGVESATGAEPGTGVGSPFDSGLAVAQPTINAATANNSFTCIFFVDVMKVEIGLVAAPSNGAKWNVRCFRSRSIAHPTASFEPFVSLITRCAASPGIGS